MDSGYLSPDPTIPLIFPVIGVTVQPRETVQIEPLEMTKCVGRFNVLIQAKFGRVSLPDFHYEIEDSEDGQPGVRVTEVSPYVLNGWFANLYYQSVMYDAKPYTDIVTLSLEDVDAKTTKTAQIMIRVE